MMLSSSLSEKVEYHNTDQKKPKLLEVEMDRSISRRKARL